MLIRIAAAEALARLDEFATVVDARSPSEFSEDHLPGACNWPSLSDAERAWIGTQNKTSSFTAQKRGAALIARNIAAHIDRYVADKPKDWRPLLYCWRGGQRSGALALVLSEIGFRVHLLEGGYRQYRRAVLAALEALPVALPYRVICGPTGSGKSRLLGSLRAHGAQVLDLEALANHRGSVLGLKPGERQPAQKQFDSRVWEALRHFDPARPVFIESESQKIGDLRVPFALIQQMRRSPCLRLDLPLDARVALLLEEYDFFVTDAAAFSDRLDALRATRGHERVNAWQQALHDGATAQVVRELLLDHYDPSYRQSLQRNFGSVDAPRLVLEWDGSAAALDAAAARAIEAG